ncbi:MAG: hypothetical protein O2962_03560 [Cyanobacteria bacterium]|nr:hypothetical protein [Cyanobacteriota bacterium]
MGLGAKHNSDLANAKQVSLFDTSCRPITINDSSQEHPDYLDYPGTRELLAKVQEILACGKRVSFKLGKLIENNKIDQADFLCDTQQDYKLRSGCKSSPSGIILTQAIAGQKFIGDFSIAYIEAMAARNIHQAHYKDIAVDHFHFTEGICNIAQLSDCIHAHKIKKNNLAIALIPANAIKAARKNRFSGWDLPQFKQQTASINQGKIYHVNKNREVLAEVNLVEEATDSLASPIYKIKLDERWLIIVPQANNYQNISGDFKLEISNKLIDSIAHKKAYHPEQDQQIEAIELESSLGQAARVIFNLLGDYEAVPEALLNLEGGSWAALATESSASGRHDGSNSMHEVLRNGWHKHAEIAIPWNYLSFEKLAQSNQASDSDYLLAWDPQADLYIESNQSWKRSNRSEVISTLKYVYEQYRTVASKQFLLSAKEQMIILAKYIASQKLKSVDFEYSGNTELVKYLEMIYKTHESAAAVKHFYSNIAENQGARS